MVDVLFLWVTFVLFINNSKGDNGCKHFEYLECIPDKTLVGHVIKTLKVITPGLAQCQSMCYAEPEDKCISYNLSPEESHVRTCELNRFDHLTSPQQLKPTEKTGYHYCPIKNACSSNLCQNNGSLCMPDSTGTPTTGFWAAWGAWSSHCSLPRKRKRVCANPLTQAQAPLSECGKEDGSEEQISPPKDCVSHESLGMKDERIIPNGNFGASSYANSPCLPHFARLDSKGWCAARRQTGESVWVDLNAVKTTTKISMRGRDDIFP